LQMEKLDTERLKLQELLMRAELDKKNCSSEIERLLKKNTELNEVVEELNAELSLGNIFENEKADVSMQEAPTSEAMEALEQALSDTLVDLESKVEEIDGLKKALAAMSNEKTELEQAVTRHTILAEILSIDNENEQKDDEGSVELAKIAKLQEAVEKCMFRIALLTEKNEQYKMKIRHAQKRAGLESDVDDEPGLLKTLKDGQKVAVLESLCMQRYRKLLRETAETMIGQNTRMDESF